LLAFGVCRWWSKDTVAVVTGANQGIGYEIARQLAQNGLTVVGTARSEERGKAAVEALRKELGTEAHDLVAFHPLDVTSEQSVAALAQWLRQTYGGVDILVRSSLFASELNFYANTSSKPNERDDWEVRT
jgi:carbonyl reductase 1